MPMIIIAILGMIFSGLYIFKLIKLHNTLEKKEDRVFSLGMILLMGFYEIVGIIIVLKSFMFTF